MLLSGISYCQVSPTDVESSNKFIPYQTLVSSGTYSDDDFDMLELSSGVFDTIYLGKDTFTIPITNDDAAEMEWGFDTDLLGKFRNNLSAGNLIVDFPLDQITGIRLRRREAESINSWITICDIPISEPADIQFILDDYLNRAKTTYEYSYSLIVGNAEYNDAEYNMGNLIRVDSDFDGVHILDNDYHYNTPLDVTFASQRNRPSEVVTAINGKFPFVVSNGAINYYSGNVSGTFIQLDLADCSWDVEHGVDYRWHMMDFLCNGMPKILKYHDGRIWIVMITDNPSESENEHFDRVQTSFAWTQIGDATLEGDLYENGFVQTRPGSIGGSNE